MKINTNSKTRYMNGAIASILLTVLMSASSAAMSQEDTGSGSVSRERFLHKFDIDGDGTLSQREKYHARKVHDRLDRNDDGRVGQRERQIARKVQSNRNR